MQRSERWRDLVVALLSAGLAAAALLLIAGSLRSMDVAVPDLEVPWWALVPVFAATELMVVHVQIRRESLSVSFAEVPLVLGLAFCDPVGFVAASVLGSAAGLLYRRQFGLKLPFNIALFALEAALAQWVYQGVLSGGDATSIRGFLAAVTAIVLTQALSAVVVTTVIFVKVGERDDGVLREAMTSSLAAGLANSCVGLLVIVLVATRPAALVLLLVVAVTLILAYRGYSRLRHGHARLESLYRFTDRVGDAVRTEAVVEAVLAQSRDMLAAEEAELVLLPTDARAPTRLRLTDAGVTRLPEAGSGGWWATALAGTSVLHRRGNETPGGPRDGIAAPLKVEDTVVGVLIVADRPHHLDTFSDADLRLFISLANHAALALHKAQLVDQLAAEAADQEHRSLHDSLTGLPNRRHFQRFLKAALALEPRPAVVVLDVDGFKEINEALGHDTGDLLLVEMGRRLRARLGIGSVARLGNDEFAVLLAAPRNAEEALLHTRALVAALSAPFPLPGVTVDVRVSAGLAQAPAHGDDATTLLQHADTALYAAKAHRRPVEVYDPDSDRASTHLRMTGDLRDAIADRALEVHFQPKVDPATGRAVGAEALVRWEHPAHGRVSPDEFIPLAERTGLIRPLTSLVLGAAMEACSGWRRQGHRLGVAVNLSARSLGDAELAAQVRDALEAAHLPASALTLEITETAVMHDLHRSLAVLHELRALGVQLSVDDFGTGQSSLAYLKQLPVHEMKIDKAFVMGLADDRGDAAIVTAAIDLGHALGLRVVAEGVEDRVTQSMLADWKCDLVQGFHISRPLPAGQFQEWLVSTRDRAGSPEPTAVPV